MCAVGLCVHVWWGSVCTCVQWGCVHVCAVGLCVCVCAMGLCVRVCAVGLCVRVCGGALCSCAHVCMSVYGVGGVKRAPPVKASKETTTIVWGKDDMLQAWSEEWLKEF